MVRRHQPQSLRPDIGGSLLVSDQPQGVVGTGKLISRDAVASVEHLQRGQAGFEQLGGRRGNRELLLDFRAKRRDLFFPDPLDGRTPDGEVRIPQSDCDRRNAIDGTLAFALTCRQKQREPSPRQRRALGLKRVRELLWRQQVGERLDDRGKHESIVEADDLFEKGPLISGVFSQSVGQPLQFSRRIECRRPAEPCKKLFVREPGVGVLEIGPKQLELGVFQARSAGRLRGNATIDPCQRPSRFGALPCGCFFVGDNRFEEGAIARASFCAAIRRTSIRADLSFFRSESTGRRESSERFSTVRLLAFAGAIRQIRPFP